MYRQLARVTLWCRKMGDFTGTILIGLGRWGPSMRPEVADYTARSLLEQAALRVQSRMLSSNEA